MVLVLPTVDSDYENGVNLMQRTWVAKYDVEDLNKQLADRYETWIIWITWIHSFLSFSAQF